jgi:hypothetical protein
MKLERHTKVIDANVILDTPAVQAEDDIFLFGDEPVIHLPATADLADVLVACGIAKSKTFARKTCHITWLGDKKSEKKVPLLKTSIPFGFSEFDTGKLKHRVAIWNPDTLPEEYDESD